MDILKTILTPSELHIMHLLINDVIFNVKIGETIGENILTAAGICQGDCLSALLFILYLGHAIKPTAIRHIDNLKITKSLSGLH